ncbi:GTPase Era [Oscillospiraceae bacterium OttesenSCG-928-F05]|nr:GTPase Era [Oscillospiraceae bacterium OttesenSCG-928-F05]
MEQIKTGIFSIIGRPNVGKSTLANAVAGEKVAIVSDKPQTTRNRIMAVCNREGRQYVFMDTPGFHKSTSKLGDYMNKVVRESVSDVDAVILMVEPVARISKPEAMLIERIRQSKLPAVLLINKMDTVEKDRLLEVIACYKEAWDFADYLPAAAKDSTGIDGLLDRLVPFMSDSPRLFPEDMASDQPERQMVAEILREKLLLTLDREVPHGTAVAIEVFSERDSGIIDVGATIYCEKESHKGIIIGKQGARLKEIGALAREDIERFFGTKVYLQTWVKVKENWRQSDMYVRNFGYDL